MAFSNEVLREALKQISDRHKTAQKAFEKQMSDIYAAHPELSEIDTQMQIKASKVALLMFSGNTAQAEILHHEIAQLKAQKEKLLMLAKVPQEPECSCKLCNDSGYFNGELCQCVKDAASKICYSSLLSDMPLDVSTFESFDLNFYNDEKNEKGVSPRRQMTAVLKVCRDFADNFPEGKSLLFSGSSGLGKTHLSLAIANVVLKKGYSVIYGSAQNLISEVSRETFDRSGSTEKIDSLNSCDLLILDDLGTEFSTALSSSIVYNIINTRQMKGLSTIISTNFDIKQINDAYSERVASRIIGSYTICPCFGSDIRLIKAKKK